MTQCQLFGFKNQFTQSFGDNTGNYFVKVEKGIGLNKESTLEGIHINNFFATYLLGPILILNPNFTKYLLEKMGEKEPKLAFEEDVLAAYEKRLEEMRKM